VRDDFVLLQQRIENALERLRSTSERDVRRKALRDLKAAIVEAEGLLDIKEVIESRRAGGPIRSEGKGGK
jgi:hypothetical protein